MAFELHRHGYPGIAASALIPGQAVRLDTGDVQRQVLPLASRNQEPFGVALGAASSAQAAVTILGDGDTIKVSAAASIGHGADIGAVAGTTSLGPVSGASGAVVWAIGKSVSAADGGEIFSLYIRPRQLSGTP